MKKTISLLLALVICLSLCACGDNEKKEEPATENTVIMETTTEAVAEESEELSLGDKVADEYFEVSITRAEFCQTLNADPKHEGFMLPLAEADRGSVSTSLSANEGEVYLSYSFEYKYIGKAEQTFGTCFITMVQYNNDYNFFKNYYNVRHSTVWEVLSADNLPPLSLTSASKTYKPLDPTVYEVRGFISLPKEIAENTDAPLLIKVGVDEFFKIR